MKNKLSIVANTYMKMLHFEEAGEEWLGDKHIFLHQTLLATGSVKAWTGTKEPQIFEAPSILIIDKGVEHNFIALEANTTMCKLPRQADRS